MKKNSALKLHIGCFDVPLDGWYNTDVTSHIFISRIPFLPSLLYRAGIINTARFEQHRRGVFRQVHYLDATRRFPIKENSVDAVYSSHMLYNLRLEDATFCLREMLRVLRPGGILRLALIDLDQLIQTYDAVHPEVLLRIIYQPEIAGRKNRMQWCYNENSITSLFRSTGFVSVRRRQYRESNIPDADAIDYRPDSLFIEGEKPQ